MQEFIMGLPKAELHVHLEGTLEPELKFKLAAKNNLALPYLNVQEMRAAYDFDGLTAFLNAYYEGMDVLLYEQDYYELAFAYLEKAHSQNVLYTEMFFDPQAHTSRGVDFEDVITGIHRAQVDAKQQFAIDSKLIMCFLRDHSADSAMATLELALPFKNWIIGIGVDSETGGESPTKFSAVYKRAQKAGFRLTAHCDVEMPNVLSYMEQSVDKLGIERIDHGINVVESPALYEKIKKLGLGFTFCPLQNVSLCSGMKALEFKQALRDGLLITVNSDDPAYFDGYIGDNFIALQKEVNLNRDDLILCVKNAFEMAWITPQEKDVYLQKLTDYLNKQ